MAAQLMVSGAVVVTSHPPHGRNRNISLLTFRQTCSQTMGVIIQKPDCRVLRREDSNSLAQPDLTRVLELYPEYYKQFQETQEYLMSGDGSLPIQSRHYIAYLAIRNSGCDSLISLAIKSFLAVSGEKSWVKNTRAAPQKLERLREITEILWKYPWKMTSHHIKSLTVGKESWTLSEIVQAVVIISHHQSLACFVLGTGQGRKGGREGKEVREGRTVRQAAPNQNFLTEFSWDEQGFSLMSSLYSDMANLIDEKLRNVRSLQPSQENTKEKYTENICFFVQNLHGIQQDDCRRDGVKDILSSEERQFVENCLFQDLDAEVDLHSLGKAVGYSRKVYLSVIMLEFKHQSQLLFFLQAVMKHLS